MWLTTVYIQLLSVVLSVVSGRQSVALCFTAVASDRQSVALCFRSVASGRQSVVLCFTGVASGRQSVALCISQVLQAVDSQLPHVFHRYGKQSAVSCPMYFTGMASGRQ